jgi:hypothetical protein
MTHHKQSSQAADTQVPSRIANSPDYAAPSPEEYALASAEPPHAVSLTEVAAEALRTGIAPHAARSEVPGEDALLRAGDPDVDPLNSELAGDEMPGGSNQAPDQNDVDAIGRAYGLTQQDGEILRSAEEVLEKRDAQHWNAARKDPT